MRGKKLLAVVLCAAVALSLLPTVALAAHATVSAKLTNGNIAVIATSQTVYFNVEFKNTGTEAKKVLAKADVSASTNLMAANIVSGYLIVSAGDTVVEEVRATVKSGVIEANNNETISFSVEGDTDAVVLNFPFAANISTGSNNNNNNNNSGGVDNGNNGGTTGETLPILTLSATGANGSAVAAPSGNAGNNVQVRLPIYNRGSKSTERATDIRVTPVLSASLDSFPFEISEVDYSRKVPDMRPGNTQEIVYNFKLSKNVTSGVKEVKFNVVYYNRATSAYESNTFSVFVTVVKGASESLTNSDGELITTTPKVIIEGSTLKALSPEEGDDADRLFAGEPFSLTMKFRNTSEEAVKNIQITLSNDGSVIMPANNGSNSLYIDKIGAGEVVERTVELQSTPDADPKPQVISVKFAYESAKTLKSYDVTETISVPISQRMRVRVDDPVMYDSSTMQDSPTPLYVSLYNMGKSQLYNCMVSIEGEGLRMEETYFHGTVSSGGTMRADFNIIPSVAGSIDAIIVITYEDAYGTPIRIEKPMTVEVMEAYDPGDMMEDPTFGGEIIMDPDQNGASGMPTWLIITLVAAGLIAVAVVITLIRRKKRKAELTEGL
ncbi:hypothetical protein LJC42_02750 [Eubacteriales bacterium OttesenSCG-928-K08]|nr:hypothetical protein [Eubacteriales bacterium OttesenSCG-928-K08]